MRNASNDIHDTQDDMQDPTPSQSPLALKHMAHRAWLKLSKWYAATDTDVHAVAAVLDPRVKIDHLRDSLRWPRQWVDDVQTKVQY
jgi:hypothetical protein